jgi:hypothetical protein
MHIDELKAALEPKRPLEQVGNYGVLLISLGVLAFLGTVTKVGDEPSTIVGPFGKRLVLYGLFACGVILVFTYPVGRFNDMAEDERKRRFKFAPYATYELEMRTGRSQHRQCSNCLFLALKLGALLSAASPRLS